ncbi:MAG: electron transport complex subunit RsxC [Endozoicomonas sp.]
MNTFFNQLLGSHTKNTTTDVIASSERKIWPLVGGVHLEENKHQSTGRPIGYPAIPAQLVLPLSQHVGAPAEPLISVGDNVLKGQIIARPNGFVSASIHAPTSGVIAAIENRPIPHPSGFSDLCIVLNSDGDDRWCELAAVDDYRSLTPEVLVEKVRDAGISGMGGAGFPTAIKLAPSNPIHTLILNGTECEPYITADDMLIRERAAEVIQGTEILMHIVGAKECLIGIEDNKSEAILSMRTALGDSGNKNIDIVVFPAIYPSGGENQLIQILMGQEVPSGKLPADLGILVQNIGTVVAVKAAILEGKPLISRIITLTGDALTEPHNVEALIGTLASDLLRHAGLQEAQLSTLIFGGPMMGFGVNNLDIPVIKTTNCLIAGTVEEFPSAPDAQACIRCGHCAEVCPSSLLPQQLYWHAKAENYEQLMQYNLFDCIECGACSFVCPSSIPLVQYYRASKGAIRTQQIKYAKAERSKVRYETRLARLEHEKAEKEAKRKVNAEQAARLKAARASEQHETGSEAKSEEDPIQAAIARAKARKAATSATAATAPIKTKLTVQQKELKMQLSVAKAQTKKTERALSAAENSNVGNIVQLKSNLTILNQQVDQLQKELDQSTQITSEEPVKAARQALSDDEKKHKIESAMVKATLEKAECALAEALEHNNENIESLKQAVKECKNKVAALESIPDALSQPKKALDSTLTKPALSNESKKLRIKVAMANAAVKKIQRAIENAGDQADLQQQLASAEQEAADLKQALENL